MRQQEDFAARQQPQVADSANVHKEASGIAVIAIAMLRERVRCYPGLRRANSTRLCATTADQT